MAWLDEVLSQLGRRGTLNFRLHLHLVVGLRLTAGQVTCLLSRHDTLSCHFDYFKFLRAICSLHLLWLLLHGTLRLLLPAPNRSFFLNQKSLMRHQVRLGYCFIAIIQGSLYHPRQC